MGNPGYQWHVWIMEVVKPMNKRRAGLGLLSVLLLLLSVPLAGCSGEVSFTTASLSEATMSLGVDADSRPVNPTSRFAPDTSEIFCSVKLSSAPPGTEVLSEWIYLRGELEGVTDHVVDTYAVTTDGTRYLQFSMTIPDAGWPVGEYALVLYVDGKEKVTLPFTVGDAVSSWATPPTPDDAAGVTISEATMSLGVDADSRPVNPTTQFRTDTPEIFCSVRISDAPANTEVVSEWVYLHGELEGVTNYVIDSYFLVTEGSRYLEFSLSIPDAGWPAGEYALLLYLDGRQAASVPFTVSDTATMPARAITLADAWDILDIGAALPAGFREVDAVAEGMSNIDLGLGPDFSEVRLYLMDNPFGLVWATMSIVEGQIAQAGTDAAMRDEAAYLQQLRQDLEAEFQQTGEGMTQFQGTTSRPNVGDMSILVTAYAVADFGELGLVDMYIDQLSFRKGECFVLLQRASYFEDIYPVPLVTIAQGIVQRITARTG